MSCTEDCSVIMKLKSMDPSETIFSTVTELFDTCLGNFST